MMEIQPKCNYDIDRFSKWNRYELRAIAEIRNGKSRPKTEGVIPVYGGNGITAYSNSSNVEGETIIIGRVGAYCGAVYFEDQMIWVSDNALYAKPKKGFQAKYIYYLLKHENLNRYAGGSSHPLLTQGRLNDLDFRIPDIRLQTEIAEILSSLDDKIELNNKINAELEALAQTLFKRWFVDFEFPNENGEPYKTSGGEMVESEMGMIPKGWEVGNLNNIVTLSRKSIKPFENPTKVYAYFSLPGFDKGHEENVSGEEILSSKYQVFPNSILVSKLNPRIPRIWRIKDCADDAICSTEFQVLRPNHSNAFSYVASLCKSDLYLQNIQSKVTGTSGSHQRVQPNDLIDYLICLPTKEILELYHRTVNPIWVMMQNNREESRKLISVRDLLLPKLVSGQLDILDQTQITVL